MVCARLRSCWGASRGCAVEVGRQSPFRRSQLWESAAELRAGVRGSGGGAGAPPLLPMSAWRILFCVVLVGSEEKKRSACVGPVQVRCKYRTRFLGAERLDAGGDGGGERRR
jgi:hypothetical protein